MTIYRTEEEYTADNGYLSGDAFYEFDYTVASRRVDEITDVEFVGVLFGSLWLSRSRIEEAIGVDVVIAHESHASQMLTDMRHDLPNDDLPSQALERPYALAAE
jgi:hypothetical protein